MMYYESWGVLSFMDIPIGVGGDLMNLTTLGTRYGSMAFYVRSNQS